MTVSDIHLASTYGVSRSGSISADLVDRLVTGDPQAVGEVYDLHHQPVRAFATRLVGDPTAAEDLVHDVFVALPRAARRFKQQSSLRSFLIGIAIKHARHHVRAASPRRAALDRLAAQPLSPPPNPEQQPHDGQLAAALTRALDDLPLAQRVAFVLCEVEERTCREAATILGVPEGTVRSRIHHGKRKLRAALSREGLR